MSTPTVIDRSAKPPCVGALAYWYRAFRIRMDGTIDSDTLSRVYVDRRGMLLSPDRFMDMLKNWNKVSVDVGGTWVHMPVEAPDPIPCPHCNGTGKTS